MSETWCHYTIIRTIIKHHVGIACRFFSEIKILIALLQKHNTCCSYFFFKLTLYDCYLLLRWNDCVRNINWTRVEERNKKQVNACFNLSIFKSILSLSHNASHLKIFFISDNLTLFVVNPNLKTLPKMTKNNKSCN